jgi:DNA adenine methylase
MSIEVHTCMKDVHKPILKWPGGKRSLAKSILALIPPEFNRYFEPFLGGGAVFFQLQPKRAFLADADLDLINCYTQVRDSPDKVIKRLAILKNTASDYYKIRAQEPRTEAARAARLIYLSTLAFNGIYRRNLAGKFNVPYGYKTHLDPCDRERIREASAVLAKTSLRCCDFEAAVRNARDGDVVYLDPPYTVAHQNNGFVKYNAKIFSWSDQERLARVARDLCARGCTVIVSNADHPSIVNLYLDFKIIRVARPSNISAKASSRISVTECLFYR